MNETLLIAGISSAYWHGKDCPTLKSEVRLHSFTISEQGYIVTVLMSELCCDAGFCKTAQRVSKHGSLNHQIRHLH